MLFTTTVAGPPDNRQH